MSRAKELNGSENIDRLLQGRLNKQERFVVVNYVAALERALEARDAVEEAKQWKIKRISLDEWKANEQSWAERSLTRGD